jgi:NAD/NADP transhydrogenase alpha subunit
MCAAKPASTTSHLVQNSLTPGYRPIGEAWYARELTDKERLLEQQVLDKHLAEAEVAITTFGVPERPHRRLIAGPPWIG